MQGNWNEPNPNKYGFNQSFFADAIHLTLELFLSNSYKYDFWKIGNIGIYALSPKFFFGSAEVAK